MELISGPEMRFKKYYCWLIGISVFIIIFWKLGRIHSDIDKLQFVEESIDLRKDYFELYHQLLSIQNLYLDKINVSQPIIYAITPTYHRAVQKAELTRISQTLALVPNVQWILVEDAEKKTDLVRNLLIESGLFYVHLNAKTPAHEKITDNNSRWKFHRGVAQRNKALEFLRTNKVLQRDKGIVYFMDDDNTYSVKLFHEIGKVKKVGVWPVGFVGGLNAEAPIVDSKTGKVSGWKSGWRPERPFAIDMAGFAVNLDLILEKPDAKFHHKMKNGMQESEFLSYLTTMEDLEPLADNCTKVYVWHTRTENPSIHGTIPGLEV